MSFYTAYSRASGRDLDDADSSLRAPQSAPAPPPAAAADSEVGTSTTAGSSTTSTTPAAAAAHGAADMSYGVFLLVTALLLSARLGIFQEVLYRDYGRHSQQALFFTVRTASGGESNRRGGGGIVDHGTGVLTLTREHPYDPRNNCRCSQFQLIACVLSGFGPDQACSSFTLADRGTPITMVSDRLKLTDPHYAVFLLFH